MTKLRELRPRVTTYEAKKILARAVLRMEDESEAPEYKHSLASIRQLAVKYITEEKETDKETEEEVKREEIVIPNQEKPGPCPCTNCHKSTHIPGLPIRHACPRCEKMFHKTSHLRVHLATHQVEGQYMCSVCSTKFKRHDMLVRHLYTHDTDANKKRFMCKFCKSTFSRKDNCKTHIKRKAKCRQALGKDDVFSGMDVIQSIIDKSVVVKGPPPPEPQPPVEKVPETVDIPTQNLGEPGGGILIPVSIDEHGGMVACTPSGVISIPTPSTLITATVPSTLIAAPGPSTLITAPNTLIAPPIEDTTATPRVFISETPSPCTPPRTPAPPRVTLTPPKIVAALDTALPITQQILREPTPEQETLLCLGGEVLAEQPRVLPVPYLDQTDSTQLMQIVQVEVVDGQLRIVGTDAVLGNGGAIMGNSPNPGPPLTKAVLEPCYPEPQQSEQPTDILSRIIEELISDNVEEGPDATQQIINIIGAGDGEPTVSGNVVGVVEGPTITVEVTTVPAPSTTTIIISPKVVKIVNSRKPNAKRSTVIATGSKFVQQMFKAKKRLFNDVSREGDDVAEAKHVKQSPDTEIDKFIDENQIDSVSSVERIVHDETLSVECEVINVESGKYCLSSVENVDQSACLERYSPAPRGALFSPHSSKCDTSRASFRLHQALLFTSPDISSRSSPLLSSPLHKFDSPGFMFLSSPARSPLFPTPEPRRTPMDDQDIDDKYIRDLEHRFKGKMCSPLTENKSFLFQSG